jgi:hypothetical protein
VDSVDHSIPAELFTQREKVKSIFGEHTRETRALRLDWWYKKHKVKRQDSLLVTILDWSAGKVRLEPESYRDYQRQTAEIEAANHQMADMLFDMLEEEKREYLWGARAIPTVYARLKDQTKTPADHWLQVLVNDSRMYWTGSDIRYADRHSRIESALSDIYQNKAAKPKKLTAEQRNQVYRFKAYFKYHKRIWRKIEIQGGQTMIDLDRIMRDIFQHDTMDHLGGFWHLIRRGNSRRFREVDPATVYPYGDEGEGADTLLANLGLEAGERLKYVYDFGDWIEHYLDLEEVTTPEADADYPRVVAQNKPRYQYCPSCKEQGRKTIATYVCISCSNEKQEDVLVCEDCIFPDHEDHYLDEMVY